MLCSLGSNYSPGAPSSVLAAAEAMHNVDTAGSACQACANAEVVRLMHNDSTEASGRASDASSDKWPHCSQPCGETVMRRPRGYAMVTQKRSPTTCYNVLQHGCLTLWSLASGIAERLAPSEIDSAIA